MSVKGGAIALFIYWDCDFDFNSNECSPTFTFNRMDNPNSELSSGYNFRFANYFRIGNGEEYRDLYKVYGIRFVFLNQGIARKFDFVLLGIQIGTGIGIMFIATYISDLICVWFLPSSPFYRNKKYMNVDEQKKESRRQEWKTVLTQDQLNKAYF